MAGLTRSKSVGDPLLAAICLAAAGLVLLLMLGILWELAAGAGPIFRHQGWSFLVSSRWSPPKDVYGALSSIYGTLMSTAIALAVAVPLAIIIALFLVELAPPKLAATVGTAIELLAAIPSIIYGMWGAFVFAPFVAKYIQPVLAGTHLGLFSTGTSGGSGGLNLFTAGLILALMVLPFITAVTRDVFRMTPPVLREAAFGMGSTTWESTRKVMIPYGLRGIMGAGFLGLGRAIGETMAVTFVIGNSHRLGGSLFAPSNTIASTLANEFNEAGDLQLSALMALGLILFLITIAVQVAAQAWLAWAVRRKA